MLIHLLLLSFSFSPVQTVTDSLPEQKIRAWNSQALKMANQNPTEARLLLDRAVALLPAVGSDSLRMETEKNLGILAWYNGSFEQALERYLRASDLALTIGDSVSFIKMQTNIGMVYSNVKEYEKAENYYGNSIRYLLNKPDQRKLLGNAYMSMGIVKRRAGKYPDALSTFEKALKIFREEKWLEGEAQVLSNMGNVYVDQRDFRSAEFLIKKALTTAEQLGNANGRVSNMLSLGEAYLLQQKWLEATEILENGLKLAQEKKFRNQISLYYLRLSKAAEGLGDSKRALMRHKEFTAITDSLNKEAQVKELNRLESQAKLRQIERENELLKTANSADRNRLMLQRTFVVSLTFGVVALLILIFYLQKARIALRQQKISLAESASIIQKQTEQLLAKSEGRLQQILDNALDAVIEMDKNGLILSWSKRAETIFGFSATEMIGQPMAAQIIPERLRATHQSGFERYKQSGESRVLGRIIELSALRKDGTEFPVELIISRFEHEGTIIFNAFIRDITDKKKAQEELQTAQQNILNGMAERNSLIEKQKLELEQRVLERTEELTQKNAVLASANREIQRQHDELKKTQDGLERALRDLRATQNQLIQQEKLASLGQLTAGIAHEIKNPLNFVNNFSDITVELVEELREALVQNASEKSNAETLKLMELIAHNARKIHEHGSRADRIVRSMLEHARSDSGSKIPTDLNLLVRENGTLAFHSMRSGLRKMPCELLFHLDDAIGLVPVIPQDFARVVLNIAGNAFDAMWEKWNETANSSVENKTPYQPSLEFRTTKTESGATISIIDNGPGIPQDIRDRILQPFFTTKKGAEGTGLGLSISNDILAAHGFSLKIESEPGRTVFEIGIPG